MIQIVPFLALSAGGLFQNQDARDIFNALSRKARSIIDESLIIEYEYQFSIDRQLGEQWEPLVTKSVKRVVLELNVDGSLREASWTMDPTSGFIAPRPFAEALFDGKRLLWLDVAEANSALHVALYPQPTLSESLGMRGDGFLVMLGRTPFYTERELSVFELAVSGENLTIERNQGKSVRIKCSQSPIGQVSLELEPSSLRLIRLEVKAESPQHFYHGARLDSAGKRSISLVAFDFEYESPTTENLLGLRSWRFEESHERVDGSKHRVTGLIRVVRLSKSPRQPIDFDKLVNTVNEIPDGTIVRISGMSAFHYVILGGRLVASSDPVMERQLDDAVAGLEANVPIADGQGGRGGFWILGVWALFVVSVLLIAWWSRGRGRKQC